MRRSMTLAVGFVAAAILAGCTFEGYAHLTVSPESFSETVATALQESVGAEAPPNIDCGEEDIPLVEDDVVVCALSVDGDEAIYDTMVTITEVDGLDYTINAQVAPEPR